LQHPYPEDRQSNVPGDQKPIGENTWQQ